MYRFAPDVALTQPQRLNLYSMALNNPLSYRDLNGLDAGFSSNTGKDLFSQFGSNNFDTPAGASGPDTDTTWAEEEYLAMRVPAGERATAVRVATGQQQGAPISSHPHPEGPRGLPTEQSQFVQAGVFFETTTERDGFNQALEALVARRDASGLSTVADLVHLSKDPKVDVHVTSNPAGFVPAPGHGGGWFAGRIGMGTGTAVGTAVVDMNRHRNVMSAIGSIPGELGSIVVHELTHITAALYHGIPPTPGLSASERAAWTATNLVRTSPYWGVPLPEYWP
jgi:hypothetical protein